MAALLKQVPVLLFISICIETPVYASIWGLQSLRKTLLD